MNIQNTRRTFDENVVFPLSQAKKKVCVSFFNSPTINRVDGTRFWVNGKLDVGSKQLALDKRV